MGKAPVSPGVENPSRAGRAIFSDYAGTIADAQIDVEVAIRGFTCNLKAA